MFRYALRAHKNYDPEEAIHFAWEDNNELLAIMVRPSSPEILAQDQHSFSSISGENVILVNCKVAEEGPEKGIIIRLWNVGEKDSAAQVNISKMWKINSVERTDLLERSQESLDILNNSAKLKIRARSLKTARIENR